jgi:hypothetical protein
MSPCRLLPTLSACFGFLYQYKGTFQAYLTYFPASISSFCLLLDNTVEVASFPLSPSGSQTLVRLFVFSYGGISMGHIFIFERSAVLTHSVTFVFDVQRTVVITTNISSRALLESGIDG